MTALDWSPEKVIAVMGTLTELDAPPTASRRHALLRDLAQYAAEAQGQRHEPAEKLGRADRFVTTLQDNLQDKNRRAEGAAVA